MTATVDYPSVAPEETETTEPAAVANRSRLERWVFVLSLPLLLLAPFAVYGRFILGDELANADVFLAYRPAHEWLAFGLREGRIPLWNPHLLGGFPLAFSEYGWFSPLNWLPLALFGGHAGFYSAVALYVALASLSCWALAREWGAGPAGALVAGLAYGHSLFVVGGAPLLNQGAAYWALPALCWCVHRHWRGWPLAAPLAGLVVALTLLGSHPQLAIISLSPPALYALGLTVRTRRWDYGLLLAVAAIAGAGVSAVRFVPTLPLLQASVRSAGLSVEASAIGSVAPQALLVGWLFPSLEVPRVLNPQWTAYVGPLPLVLAGVAIWGALRRRSAVSPGQTWGPPPAPALIAIRARIWWLSGLAVAGIVLALGGYTPVYWLVQRTPLLTYFREPSRFLLWCVLALALLAAFGLDRLLQTSASERVDSVGSALSRLAARWWPIWSVAAVVAGFAAMSIALHLVEPRALSSLQLRALRQFSRGDYPPGHYLSLANRSWRQMIHSVDPTQPGLFVPLAAMGAAAWWWSAGRRTNHPGVAAVICVALPLLSYSQVRLPAVPASVVRETPALAVDFWTGGVPTFSQTGTGDDVAGIWPRVISWLPLAADFENRTRLEGLGRNAETASYRLLKHMLTPNTALNAGVSLVDGYENLMTREQALLVSALGSERAGNVSALSLSESRLSDRQRQIGERWGLIRAAGAGILVTTDRLQPLTWPMWVRYEPAAVAGAEDVPSLNVFQVVRPLPRATVIREWRVASSAEEALAMLVHDGVHDGAVSAVITAPSHPSAGTIWPRSASADQSPDDLAAPSARERGVYEATITHYSEERVDVAVESDTDAILILLDANAPGWTATVTGLPSPILHVNVAFRAVSIPAGRHLVRFEYAPPSWVAALSTTAGSVLLLSVYGGLSGWALATSRRGRLKD
jgi:hypothetical protein